MLDDRYQLIDFGDGRKLESLAGYLVDRPCPAAEGLRRLQPHRWTQADSRYDAVSRRWTHHQAWPEKLAIDCGTFRMPVRPTPYGHIGLFPEQAENWQWLGQQQVPASETREALNLFGYTGASTMALVAAGYRVAHVDAAKPNVQAARLAAETNGWSDAPIRYLVDDAAKFVARELRRGRVYHAIVLDPPAYGHSPGGKAWRLERDLWPLLENCLRILAPDHFRVLVTGHSPQVDQEDVARFLRQHRLLTALSSQGSSPIEAKSGLRIQSGRSQLEAAAGRKLDAGFYVRLEHTLLNRIQE